ncbi:MAG: hypothetical protein AAF304_04370 [Pseudomonadota bacterium]
MNESIEISGHPIGTDLYVRTPGRYAMDTAIDVLKFLDEQAGISVKDTGWKNGFGLKVCEWIPIHSDNLIAKLQTDGDEFEICKVSGTRSEYESLIEIVKKFLSEKAR